MATAQIKSVFRVVTATLIETQISPQDMQNGKVRGDPIGVRVELQPTSLPAGASPAPTGIQIPLYAEGAADLLVPGATVEMSLSRVDPPAGA